VLDSAFSISIHSSHGGTDSVRIPCRTSSLRKNQPQELHPTMEYRPVSTPGNIFLQLPPGIPLDINRLLRSGESPQIPCFLLSGFALATRRPVARPGRIEKPLEHSHLNSVPHPCGSFSVARVGRRIPHPKVPFYSLIPAFITSPAHSSFPATASPAPPFPVRKAL
jgi:hypothetical protein